MRALSIATLVVVSETSLAEPPNDLFAGRLRGRAPFDQAADTHGGEGLEE